MACHWPLSLNHETGVFVMQHGVVLTASVAQNAVYQDLVAVVDQATNQFNGRYVFQEDRRIVAAMAWGLTLTAARITTPTMRLINYPEIFPPFQGTIPGTITHPYFYGTNGPLVVMNDELAVQASQGFAGAEQEFGAIWTDPAPRPAPAGQVFTCKVTASIVGVTLNWTAGPVTFVQQLPAGRYAVTGMYFTGPNVALSRLIFPNQATRPMCTSSTAIGNAVWPFWRFGAQGLLGEFHTYAPPQLEVFCNGAGSTQQGVIDVVRIGDR